MTVVVAVTGVGGSSGIGEGKGSGGNEPNSGNSNGGGPYNNQLKDPAEETTAATMVTAMDTVTATVKTTEKDENNANNDNGKSRIATKTASPGMHLEAETSPLPWHSVSVAMTVRRNRNDKKYTAQPPPVLPIVQIFCCRHHHL